MARVHSTEDYWAATRSEEQAKDYAREAILWCEGENIPLTVGFIRGRFENIQQIYERNDAWLAERLVEFYRHKDGVQPEQLYLFPKEGK